MDSSTEWIYGIVEEQVKKITFDQSRNWLIISRKKGESFNLAVISKKIVTLSDIPDNCLDNNLNFLVNIPKEAYVYGDVLVALENSTICFGGVGDLSRFINQEYNWPYENPEVAFILRGLAQHDKVKNIKRLDYRRYEVIRHFLPSVTVLALNDYDLSIESVRNGKQQYKEFDVILTSNPNARVTSSAKDIAKDFNVRILTFRQLLGSLNSE